MSFLTNLQNAKSVTESGTHASIIINGGNADAKITTLTENACIWTGNGDQTINSECYDELYIRTGKCGADTINVEAGTADIKTYGCADTVNANCGKLTLDVGEGDDEIVAYTSKSFNISGGNGDKTLVAECSTSSKCRNYINFKDGDEDILFVANNTVCTTGNGKLDLGYIGNNARVTSGDGDSVIGFWGDNSNIKLGDGTHDVRTLDNWYQADDTEDQERFEALADTLADRVAAYDNDKGASCYNFSGAKNLTLEVGQGTLQGLVTVGDGTLTVKEADALDNVVERKIDIRTGIDPTTGTAYEDMKFEEGIFKGQNGYVIYPSTS